MTSTPIIDLGDPKINLNLGKQQITKELSNDQINLLNRSQLNFSSQSSFLHQKGSLLAQGDKMSLMEDFVNSKISRPLTRYSKRKL